MTTVKILGRDAESRRHWEDESQTYVEALGNPYHRHRLEVIEALIPPSLYGASREIFDFGCGDAVLFPAFLGAGAAIRGVDVSERMIGIARRRLQQAGWPPELVDVGSVAALGELETASLDAVFSFNVLAYLTDHEEQRFYTEVARAVKPGGFLVVTHSNELFDMFSLNRYTAAFFNRHFIHATHTGSEVESLLTHADSPHDPTTYNIRENPLTYQYKLARFGFRETRQEFINLHYAPPQLLSTRTYPNTLAVPPAERWKLLFACSTYGSCAVRE